MSEPAEAILGIQVRSSTGLYHLLNFLGGGQTANVYRAQVLENDNPTRINSYAAVKLMTPGLDDDTQRRFFLEADTLLKLQDAKDKLCQELEVSSPFPEVPAVWDQQRTGGMRFFVMTLAPGVSLDQLLRSDKPLSEVDALTITAQLLVVFAALHEGLGRSYLDFQPRNIFWQADHRYITVIDWNLLSAEGQADPAADLLNAGQLLYRMIMKGTNATPQAKKGLDFGKDWGHVSYGTRQLLRQALDQRRLSPFGLARDFYRAVQAQLDLWHQDGDHLLTEAGEKLEQNPDPDDIPARRRLTQGALTLFDMAQRRGISPYMLPVHDGLQQSLREQEHELAPLQRGRMFLEGGEWTRATREFDLAAQEAQTLSQRLAVWRWQEICRAAQSTKDDYRSNATAIGDALQILEAIPAWGKQDWQTLHDQMASVVWDGFAVIHREVNAYAKLQRNLNWISATEDTTTQASSDNVLRELDTASADLNQLPETTGERSYRRDAWAFIGDGAPEAGEQWVETLRAKISTHKERQEQIQKKLAAVRTLEEWQQLIREFRGDPLVTGPAVKVCLDWLAQSHQKHTVELCNTILDYTRVASTREEAEKTILLARYFQDVEQGLAALHTLYWQKASKQGRLAHTQDVENSPPNDSKATSSITPTPDLLLDDAECVRAALTAALNRLFTSLPPDHPGAHSRAQGLLSQFLQLSIATAQNLHSAELLAERLGNSILTDVLKCELQTAKADQDLSRSAEENRQQIEKQKSAAQTEHDEHISRLATERETAAADIAAQRQQLDTARQEVAAEISAQREQWATERERLKAQAAAAIKTQREQSNQQLEAERAAVAAEIAAQRKQWADDLADMQGQAEAEKVARLETLNAQIATAQQQAAQLTTANDAAAQRLVVTEQMAAERERVEQARLQQAHAQACAELADVRQALATAQAEYQRDLARRREKLETDSRQRETELKTALEARLAQLRDAVGERKEDIRRLTNQIQELTNEIGRLKRESQTAAMMPAGTPSQLVKAYGDLLEATHALIAGLADAPARGSAAFAQARERFEVARQRLAGLPELDDRERRLKEVADQFLTRMLAAEPPTARPQPEAADRMTARDEIWRQITAAIQALAAVDSPKLQDAEVHLANAIPQAKRLEDSALLAQLETAQELLRQHQQRVKAARQAHDEQKNQVAVLQLTLRTWEWVERETTIEELAAAETQLRQEVATCDAATHPPQLAPAQERLAARLRAVRALWTPLDKLSYAEKWVEMLTMAQQLWERKITGNSAPYQVPLFCARGLYEQYQRQLPEAHKLLQDRKAKREDKERAIAELQQLVAQQLDWLKHSKRLTGKSEPEIQQWYSDMNRHVPTL